MQHRQHLLLPSPLDMGIHIRQASTQRLPTMARLRPPHGGAPLDMVRDRNRRCPSTDHILPATILDVHRELCFGRLGHP